MQRTVPRGETGVLADSLQIFPVRKAQTRSSIRVGAGKEGWYGAFLEYGIHARRHVRRARGSGPRSTRSFGATVETFREEFGASVERATDTLAERR